ncbi:hypothetical protein RhiJN_24590 [Ceratobasidium sp. AG-Ba]|nr:hypothetical protein RhiJN_24590 [Ceratobasidium sp. AG-Ba]
MHYFHQDDRWMVVDEGYLRQVLTGGSPNSPDVPPSHPYFGVVKCTERLIGDVNHLYVELMPPDALLEAQGHHIYGYIELIASSILSSFDHSNVILMLIIGERTWYWEVTSTTRVLRAADVWEYGKGPIATHGIEMHEILNQLGSRK